MGVAPGRYQVIAYNSKNCPAASEYFEIINPPFPVIDMEDRIVGCEVGVGLDIRDYIPNYDPSVYDYQLESPLGIYLENKEMADVQISGNYFLRVKHKDLPCWSPTVPFELIINTIPLIPNFDYGVDGTGVKSEEEGGIFIDDPIRFQDLSSGNAVSWEWDFGDGARSTLQHPIHTFGKMGVFQVQLAITNDLGCKKSITIELPLTLSYRVMIPTGFTPTLSDNNFFRPKTKGIVAMEMYIFNLWGNLVFKSDGMDTLGWDGKINGELAPAGNYAYRIKMRTVDGETIEEGGRLTLIR
ncbi:PKD domain-containing protein [Cecembia calidifontis]|jgi:gliding motility-associated-like protein|uniref:Gliding motility-associated-like protein n=1 Tax=Cecembia calidifontis TaxID=1187080 RepID=A0A4Q7PAK1_9BACT|nr:PKD domain-containing protein [Cecembia calidifontis]RZS96570.1 gliding motility-associated-like protein [Cecembia calidifontis]